MISVESSIVDRLKALKAKTGMTALEISEKSGIPESTVTRIFSGKTANPTVATIVAIYKAMGGTAAEIFGDDVRVNVVSEVSPTSKESAELITLYKETIKTKDRYIKVLSIALAVLIAFIMAVVLIDLLNGHFGFVRYLQGHTMEILKRLC